MNYNWGVIIGVVIVVGVAAYLFDQFLIRWDEEDKYDDFYDE